VRSGRTAPDLPRRLRAGGATLPDVTAPPPPRIAGLTEPTVPPIERVAIRLRESSVTLAAWRLAASGAEGSGTLVRVETPGGALFRGEGWFLGWTQDAMSEAWTALLPTPPSDGPELAQLG
jgi:hypothetical protein